MKFYKFKIIKKNYMKWRSIIDTMPTTWRQKLKRGFARDKCVLKKLCDTCGLRFELRFGTESYALYYLET